MNNEYNLSILEALFTDHLRAVNISSVSIKNYRSDIKLFTNWFYAVSSGLIDHTSDEYVQPTYIELFIVTSSKQLIEDFKRYLLDGKTPLKTINRRLSAVRKFYSFCVKRGVLSSNPTVGVTNVSYVKSIQEIPSHEALINAPVQTVDEFKAFLSTKMSSELQDDTVSEYQEFIKLWS